MSGVSPRLAVAVVTHGHREDIAGCLEAAVGLAERPLEVVVVDCASDDGTVEETGAVLERLHSRLAEAGDAGVTLRSIPLEENRGFAGGMNLAVAETEAPWVLSLNPDARPAPDYVTRLLEAAEATGGSVGAVTGRLLRPAPEDGGARLLDACGMRLVPTWRHLDRGSGEPDRGQLDRRVRVFGATGAASLFRRAALDDVAVDGEVFDPRFHSFREDAELAFRLQERGWEVVYEPAARCEHRRFNLPERRSAMPPVVNYHSLKNRYLLRAYHQTAINALWTAPFTLWRDLLALGYVVLRERSSLAAYAWLWRNRRDILARRRGLQARRTASAWRLDRWFVVDSVPVDVPVDASGEAPADPSLGRPDSSDSRDRPDPPDAPRP